MTDLAMFAMLYRELLSSRRMPRVPEPQAMDASDQVLAYADSGRQDDGIMAVSNLFHAAHISSVITGCDRVVDLGCGPATQLVRIAQLNPQTEFIGVELSDEMVANAREHIRISGAANVTVQKGDITQMRQFADQSIDGVISTVTLHHLPELATVQAAFKEVDRVLKPGGAIYLSDFCRLKSLKSVVYFAYKYDKILPPVLCLDYERSLRAAFTEQDFRASMPLLGRRDVRMYTTKFVPFMMVIKTPDRSHSPLMREQVKQRQEALSAPYRRELRDLRRFFRMNGMPDTVFD